MDRALETDDAVRGLVPRPGEHLLDLRAGGHGATLVDALHQLLLRQGLLALKLFHQIAQLIELQLPQLRRARLSRARLSLLRFDAPPLGLYPAQPGLKDRRVPRELQARRSAASRGVARWRCERARGECGYHTAVPGGSAASGRVRARRATDRAMDCCRSRSRASRVVQAPTVTRAMFASKLDTSTYGSRFRIVTQNTVG